MVLAYLVPLYSRYDGVIAPWDVLNIQEHLVTHYVQGQSLGIDRKKTPGLTRCFDKPSKK